MPFLSYFDWQTLKVNAYYPPTNVACQRPVLPAIVTVAAPPSTVAAHQRPVQPVTATTDAAPPSTRPHPCRRAKQAPGPPAVVKQAAVVPVTGTVEAGAATTTVAEQINNQKQE